MTCGVNCNVTSDLTIMKFQALNISLAVRSSQISKLLFQIIAHQKEAKRVFFNWNIWYISFNMENMMNWQYTLSTNLLFMLKMVLGTPQWKCLNSKMFFLIGHQVMRHVLGAYFMIILSILAIVLNITNICNESYSRPICIQ